MKMISFTARLLRPANADDDSWSFLKVPQDASDQLPSRGLVAVDGTLNGNPFQVVLQPDGQGGHWLKVEADMTSAINVQAGDVLSLKVAPALVEPEPRVPPDVAEALATDPKAQAVWQDITTVARRDWIHWITSGKRAETRVKRIQVACSKLSSGSRRPCCFDSSGMYSKSLSCPVAEDGFEESAPSRQGAR